MPARTGAQFLRGLRDNREVWLGGHRVTDPLDHPALRGAAESIAAVFDLHYQYPDDCLMPDPETGEKIAVSHSSLDRSRTCCAATRHYAASPSSPSA
jgi:4-hydroxyphenylacetate 3-monooxygenase